MSAYPEAKVVLVERDLESWYASFERGIIAAFCNPVNRILQILDPQVMGPVKKMWNYVFEDEKGYFRASTKKELQENARSVYKEHYALVRKVTPKERLLEFDLRDGWGPLCEFLGKAEPGAPFPRLNEGDTLKERVKGFQKQCLSNVLRNLALGSISVVVGLFAVMWSWRQLS